MGLHHALLACPTCGAQTRRTGDDEVCTACGVVGRWIDDLPCYSDPDYYWGEISRAEMARANQLAVAEGWEAAVDATVADPAVRDYIRSPHRADFQYVWELPKTSAVLEVGAGWGSIAMSLGRSFDRVVAVEGVLERARFIRTRAAQLGRGTVDVVCADFLRLPLARQQFDAVVLNGALEWVGLAGRSGDPRALQLALLRRLHELLRPNGFLCVGIENRVGWDVLRNGTDHSGYAYTSLMPRPVADIYCRLRAGRYRSEENRGYRTYTYSLPGYRQLFREAGFPTTRAWHAWNGYNRPDVLLPLDGPEALVHFAGRMDVRHQRFGAVRHKALELAARTGLWGLLATDFVFVVEKR